MSKLCNKCGQVLEDELTVCPYCGREVEPVVNENNNIEDIIEVPIVNQTDNSTLDGTVPLVMAAPTLDDIKPINEVENIAITNTPSEVVTPVEVQAPEIVPVIEPVVEQEPTVEEVTPVEELQPVEVQVSEAVPVVEPVVEQEPTVEEVTQVEELQPVEVQVSEAVPVIEPVVEQEPTVEEVTPVVEVQPVEVQAPEAVPVAEPVVEQEPTVEEVTPVEELQPVEVQAPEAVPVVEPVVEQEPTVEEVTPVVELQPVEVQAPEAVPVVEPVVEQEPTVEEVTPVVEVQPVEVQVSEAKTPEVPEMEKIDGKEKLEIPTPEINITTPPVVVETAPNLGDANNILTTVEVEVENNSLETISVEANKEVLVEEEEVFEIPVMPEPSIGEINPELLGNKYDNEEQANQEKLEAKKKIEEQEQERRMQEELAKREIPMERPDLLAGFGQPDPTVEVEEPKTKKTGGKKTGLIIAILIILVIGGIAAWFVLSGGLDKLLNKEPKYLAIDPVNTYYEGFNEGNSEKIISAFVPCLANSDNVSNIVTNSLNMKNQNPNMKITFSEINTEVVNGDDAKHLDKHLLDNCSSKPEISDYKHIFIEQKTKLNTDSKEELSETEFWVAQIKEKWYIIMIQ